MIMFLAWKEIKKEKTRFAMIILVTTLIAYLVYFLTGLAYGLASANTTSVDHWQAKGVILSESANENIYASVIDQKKADELAIKKSEPLNITSTVVSINNKKEQFDLVLMGVKTDSQLLLPKIVEGKKVTKEDEIVLSESFKEKSSVSIGDKIKVVSVGRVFKVVGFSEKSEYNTQAVGYVSLEMASQAMMSYTTGDDSADATASATPNMPNRISALIVNETVKKSELEKNDLVYLSKDEFINGIPGYQAQLLTFGLMIVSLIIISSVIISIFMYILTMQKKSIFAILKIQGINNGFVSRSVVFQTLIVIVAGTVLGVVLTLITFNFLPAAVPVEMNWAFTGIISGLFILSSLLGSLFSARSILKIDPLDAL